LVSVLNAADPAFGNALPRRVADRLSDVPSITGRVEVNLTVRDPARSAAWYSKLLDMQQRYD
jgi:hypothetical protein